MCVYIIIYRLYMHIYIYYTIYICKHIQSYNISVLYKHICILYNHISYDHILTGIDINIVFLSQCIVRMIYYAKLSKIQE